MQTPRYIMSKVKTSVALMTFHKKQESVLRLVIKFAKLSVLNDKRKGGSRHVARRRAGVADIKLRGKGEKNNVSRDPVIFHADTFHASRNWPGGPGAERMA